MHILQEEDVTALNGVARFRFDDGHTLAVTETGANPAIFSSPIPSLSNSISSASLTRGQQEVVRYTFPRDPTRGTADLEAGYTPEGFAAYWRAAYEYVREVRTCSEAGQRPWSDPVLQAGMIMEKGIRELRILEEQSARCAA